MPAHRSSPSASRRAFAGLVLLLAACAVVVSRAQSEPTPILILMSFDGWRWDYIDRTPSPNLKALAARGVRAEGLIPVFPSKTFPNHYTLVTGLYPDHTGIVGNTIFDPVFQERFAMASETSKNARWWGGEPIWVTAIRQGRRSAAMFWPGSEAPIRGVRPTEWKPFGASLPNSERVQTVLDWLSKPEAERPSVITMYFNEVDDAGHAYGPDSMQVQTAAAHLDAALGELQEGLRRQGLFDRTTIVVVSDHGMAELGDSQIVFLDDYVDPSDIDIVELSPVAAIWPKRGSVESIYRRLVNKNPNLAVYRKGDLPGRLHYGRNRRVAPVLALAAEGWRITTHDREANARRSNPEPPHGEHGYDPSIKSMHALFVAAGPRVRAGVVAPEFENIHVYDFLCAVVGLKPAPNDGNAERTRRFFN